MGNRVNAAKVKSYTRFEAVKDSGASFITNDYIKAILRRALNKTQSYLLAKLLDLKQ